MAWQNLGGHKCMDAVQYAQPTASWLCTACGSHMSKDTTRCKKRTCQRLFHIAGVEEQALGRAGKDKRRVERGRRPTMGHVAQQQEEDHPAGRRGGSPRSSPLTKAVAPEGSKEAKGATAQGGGGSGAKRMHASSSARIVAPQKPRALSSVSHDDHDGCLLTAKVAPASPSSSAGGPPQRGYTSPHKRQRISAMPPCGYEPLTVEEYAQGEPGYGAALALATWDRIDAWANTREHVVVRKWHLKRLFEFTTKVLVARRHDGMPAGIALLCEAPNTTDVCDSLHSHRNPSLPLVKTARMTSFGPIRDAHVRMGLDKAVGAHPIDELVLICGERGVGVAVMAHLQGRHRLLYASAVPGSDRANQFYRKYFKLLPFTRQDGEQPYVAWLGDAGLKAATAQRIQHRPATACGDQGASSHSDWTSEASTC